MFRGAHKLTIRESSTAPMSECVRNASEALQVVEEEDDESYDLPYRIL